MTLKLFTENMIPENVAKQKEHKLIKTNYIPIIFYTKIIKKISKSYMYFISVLD